MRVRASAVLGIADPLTAYCVDRALWTFARVIEEEQEAATKRLPKNAKDTTHARARERVLEKYLGIEMSEKGKFRSPG